MTTRFRTRAFLLCFIPFAFLLAGSFWMTERAVLGTVRYSLESSLRQNQASIARLYAEGQLQNSRFLSVVGENSALKACMQLLSEYPNLPSARATVEDQLRGLGEKMGFDLMFVSAPDGTPRAAVIRSSNGSSGRIGELIPLDASRLGQIRSSLLLLGGRPVQVASVPIELAGQNIGYLSVGRYLDMPPVGTPAALLRNGRVVQSNMTGFTPGELENAQSNCSADGVCELQLRGASWLSFPLQSYGDGFTLVSYEDLDEATRPALAKLHSVFWILVVGCTLLALVCSLASSSSIVKPIDAIVHQLRSAVPTGKLAELESHSSIAEIKVLTEIYNRAAGSVRKASEDLESAYLELIESLAVALDARDPYTAGHSRRVSRLSCAAASALGLDKDTVERIRIGAQLHDIGKIGVSDTILQKPGRLTVEEFELVKQHPVIGRRILEGVQGFAPFLNAVELHHENWDGTGYPKGLRGEETPVDARIIHVADAYDAMTTNRSYRAGMSHERAIAILIECAGTQFDSSIVKMFVALPYHVFLRDDARDPAESDRAAVLGAA